MLWAVVGGLVVARGLDIVGEGPDDAVGIENLAGPVAVGHIGNFLEDGSAGLSHSLDHLIGACGALGEGDMDIGGAFSRDGVVCCGVVDLIDRGDDVVLGVVILEAEDEACGAF